MLTELAAGSPRVSKPGVNSPTRWRAHHDRSLNVVGGPHLERVVNGLRGQPRPSNRPWEAKPRLTFAKLPTFLPVTHRKQCKMFF